MTRFVLLTLLACLAGYANADQQDPRLDDLFQQLKAAENERQAALVEAVIWQVWTEHDNPRFASLMNTGIAQMNRNELVAARNTFTQLIEMAPDFAEAWNKRATVHYLLQDYAASKADIDSTLALEPFHFGALSGLGLVYLGQQQYALARNAFHAALEVNPNMPGMKQNVEALNRFLGETII